MHRPQRPGPLQELPTEHYSPNFDGISSSKQRRIGKRQHSPIQPSLFSPTKRRILNDEGIHLPEKTAKTPLPSPRPPITNSACFSMIPRHTNSPARVLNFGQPKDLDPRSDSHRRSSRTSNMSLGRKSSSSYSSPVPSPELRLSSMLCGSAQHSHGVHPEDTSCVEDNYGPSSMTNPAVVCFAPRELPLQTDPRSIHFPGFFVYQDTHVAVYPTGPGNSEERRRSWIVDTDSYKENLPPRRRTKKLSTSSSTVEFKIDPDTLSAVTTQAYCLDHITSRRISTLPELPSTIASTKPREPLTYSSISRVRGSLKQSMKDEMDLDEDRNDDNA